jgi:hypothetical protein
MKAPNSKRYLEEVNYTNIKIEIIKKIEIEKIPITIWRVNGNGIRNSGKMEFSNFGQHFHFPWIPKNEFYIDQENTTDDTDFYIQHLITEYIEQSNGAKYEDALSTSNAEESADRRKSGLFKNLNKEFLISMFGLNIYRVSGGFVRTWLDVDFVEGTNYMRSKYTPKDEVFIDDDVISNEIGAIVVHELTETLVMKILGLSYNEAHFKYADPTELKYRKKELWNDIS